MACDGESPCRECKGSGSECSMDPAECGHAVLPSSDNLLERAFMARIRADEYREALAALQQEFESRAQTSSTSSAGSSGVRRSAGSASRRRRRRGSASRARSCSRSEPASSAR
jgi:hypothetical protein